MKYRLLFFGCIIHTIVTFSQGVENVGARSISLGEATVALQDVYAYFSNPAGTSAISSCVVAINYQNKFLINEFQQRSMILAVPLNKGVVTIGGMISGQSLFRSSRIGTGYSLKLSDIFSFGAQVNFQQIQIQNVTSSNDLQAALGFLLNVSSSSPCCLSPTLIPISILTVQGHRQHRGGHLVRAFEGGASSL